MPVNARLAPLLRHERELDVQIERLKTTEPE
jgi:hypothetical protein